MNGRRDSRNKPIYRDTVDEISEGIVSINSDLEVSACNLAATELLRTAETALVGNSIWDLFPGGPGTIAQTKIEDTLAEQQQQSFEWYDPDTLTWFEVHVHPGDDGLSLCFTELTSEGSHHRLVQLFPPSEEPIGVGGWRIDLPSETLHVSEEVLRIRGLPPDYDLTLDEGIEFYHPQDRPIMEAAVERLKTAGETYDLELREVSADGEIYWVRTTGVAEYDDNGEIIALRGVYRDITERKKNELELERRTRELQRQNERLDRFARVLSHDLRNPLNVALGRLEMANELTESDHYDAIQNALSRIDTLIEDVLDLARHGKEVADPEPVDLAGVVNECWEEVRDTDAQLVILNNATIFAERSRLRQLLGNLLRNAIEHGGDAVTVTVDDLDDGFYVEDDGPGIPADQREQVFRFGYSTSSTGTGFGLPIVREITDAHHWEVHVGEGTDGGTRFEFTGVERV